MKEERFDMYYKELRRDAEQRRRDGEENQQILVRLIARVTKAIGESFTAEQLRKIFDLGLKAQPGKRRDVTWWVHWENGVIRSYGQDLDRVKEQAEQEAKENGMEYFIT